MPQPLPVAHKLDIPAWPMRNDLRDLIARAHAQGAISDADLGRILGGLPPLMAAQLAKLNDGESTSLPLERAERLTDSILYLIGLSLQAYAAEEAVMRLCAMPLSRLFDAGRAELDRRIRAVGHFMPILRASIQPVEHAAYQYACRRADRDFFSTYDLEWGAHELNWTPSYLPALPLPEVGGILYLTGYLQALHTENRILAALPDGFLAALLVRSRHAMPRAKTEGLADELDPDGSIAAENLCALALDAMRARGDADAIVAVLGLRGRTEAYVRAYLAR